MEEGIQQYQVVLGTLQALNGLIEGCTHCLIEMAVRIKEHELSEHAGGVVHHQMRKAQCNIGAVTEADQSVSL